MKITLAPGEMLQVDFANTDGQFNIHFNSDEFPDAIAVEEVSGCTPNTVGHTGVLYHDKFEYAVGAEDAVEDVDVFDADEGDTRHVGKHPMLSAAYGIKKDSETPVGFFMDASNKVHCTALVRCQLYRQEDDTYLVEVLNDENEVLGEYTFYRTIKDIEAATGMEYDPPNLA